MTQTSAALTIAMISDDFLPAATGVGIHVQKMSREMTALGHRVIVVTTRRKGQAAEEDWEGVKVFRVFSIPIVGFYQALPSRQTLRRIVSQNHVTIVHCHYLGIMMLRMIRVAREMEIPMVLTTHMTVDHLTQPFFMRPLRPLLSRWIARICQNFGDIISVSRSYALQAERFNVSSQVHYISNPVDFDGTEVAEVTPSDQFRIFFVGRLNPEKNVQLLLRAVRLMTEKGSAVELWIAGQGSQEKELRRLTEALGIATRVKFLGQVSHNDLPALYLSCDVFVLPSLAEMQPLVALEAMRFRRPVIVTERIVSASEMIDEGKNGFIVDASGPEDLAAKLDVLRLDPDLRRRMGEAGFAKSANYTIPAVIHALEHLYQTVGSDPESRRDASVVHLDKRDDCAFCRIGTFERRAGHAVVASDARRYRDEYFVVWRCDACRSIHSRARFPLDDFHRHSPFAKLRLDRYNRIAFEGFHRWLLKNGVGPENRILFHGVQAAMFQACLEAKGYVQCDVADDLARDDRLSAAQAGSYETVIILDGLERAEDPRALFESATRQLLPAGKLILHAHDADEIRLSHTAAHLLNQPYRLHILSWSALARLAAESGLALRTVERRSHLDTRVPFVNARAFFEMPSFLDGSLESAYDFRPRDVLRKIWRIPRFVFWGLLGGIFREPSNLLAVFGKSDAGTSKRTVTIPPRTS